MKKFLIIATIIVVAVLLKSCFNSEPTVVKAPAGASDSVKHCIDVTVSTGSTPEEQLKSSVDNYEICKKALGESAESERGLVLDRLVLNAFSAATKSAKISRDMSGSNQVLDDLTSVMEQNKPYAEKSGAFKNIENQRKFIQEKVLAR